MGEHFRSLGNSFCGMGESFRGLGIAFVGGKHAFLSLLFFRVELSIVFTQIILEIAIGVALLGAFITSFWPLYIN